MKRCSRGFVLVFFFITSLYCITYFVVTWRWFNKMVVVSCDATATVKHHCLYSICFDHCHRLCLYKTYPVEWTLFIHYHTLCYDYRMRWGCICFLFMRHNEIVAKGFIWKSSKCKHCKIKAVYELKIIQCGIGFKDFFFMNSSPPTTLL